MIDASIYQNLRTPQVASPLETAGQALAIRNSIQTGAMNQERLRSEQLANQQRQVQVNDANTARQIFANNNGDIDKSLGELSGKVSPDFYMAIQKHSNETKEQLGKLDEQKRAKLQFNLQQTGASAQRMIETPADQKDAAWSQERQNLIANGADPAGLPAQYPGDAEMQFEKLHGMGLEKWLNEGRAVVKAGQETTAAADTHSAAVAKLPGEQAGSAEAVRQNDAATLSAAVRQGPQAFAAAYKALPPDRQSPFSQLTGKEKPEDIAAIGMKPAEQVTAAETARRDAESNRHNLSAESTAKLNAAVAQGRLVQEQTVNGMKYGPGTQEYWVKQLQLNPDSVKELPAELRSTVGKKFLESTGLPLPTAISGTSQTQETAARAALDNINFIRKAVQNPEIRAQLGPVLGRLGDLEQRFGSAVGLSPEAEALGQELRTRMRYFNLQEGKALLGGRPNAKLMETLAGSSANPRMDPGILEGALNGAEGSANEIMDNADKQRFGGKMRSRETRGVRAGAKTVTTQADYDAIPRGTQYIDQQDGKTYTKR